MQTTLNNKFSLVWFGQITCWWWCLKKPVSRSGKIESSWVSVRIIRELLRDDDILEMNAFGNICINSFDWYSILELAHASVFLRHGSVGFRLFLFTFLENISLWISDFIYLVLKCRRWSGCLSSLLISNRAVTRWGFSEESNWKHLSYCFFSPHIINLRSSAT